MYLTKQSFIDHSTVNISSYLSLIYYVSFLFCLPHETKRTKIKKCCYAIVMKQIEFSLQRNCSFFLIFQSYTVINEIPSVFKINKKYKTFDIPTTPNYLPIYLYNTLYSNTNRWKHSPVNEKTTAPKQNNNNQKNESTESQPRRRRRRGKKPQ